MTTTVGQTVQQLHTALRDYIEATYHISHPMLVRQRHALLDDVGVVHQRPYFESTPRYQKTQRFADIPGLAPSALGVFNVVSGAAGGERLVYDPPYEHQAVAVRTALAERKSMVVMTGTGSGKTESFLLPILGKLAIEADARPDAFRQQPAVRALVLYPMNALVNDQLGRMRLLFGDPRVAGHFSALAGRPARFARYTSRTLYPGVRSAQKDQERLKPIGDYYVDLLQRTDRDALELVRQLRSRGKWPGKPNLEKWYGKDGARWQAKSGDYLRCVTLPHDPELLTRHEVHAAPPDVLVTNYSMLEYMLMRPLERPVFDATHAWLAANPEEQFLLVLDEAHLYRGAAGTEVALLLRRLRRRLGIGAERLQVICTSASFASPERAAAFGASLTGKQLDDFVAVRGELELRTPAAPATPDDAAQLTAIDLARFYESSSPAERLACVAAFLDCRGVKVELAPNTEHDAGERALEKALHRALAAYAPMGLLVNETMRQAWPLGELEARIFPGVPGDVAAQATSALMALGSLARPSRHEPGILPCRVHAFFRGLPGLWVCADPECTALSAELRGGPAGRLYAQPQERCACGARVFELYTCRHCGTAYARAYTDDVSNPSYLWAEPGQAFHNEVGARNELMLIDLLLEDPVQPVATMELDLTTGRLNTPHPGARYRNVHLRKDRTGGASDGQESANSRETDRALLGAFVPCGVCGEDARYGRSSVQDHQTKGDQPFQALVATQLQVQPPGPQPATRFAPHRGRKVLVFSDSRQTAARLAPNIQNYSNKDVLRPLLVAGFARLQEHAPVRKHLSLDDAYLAVLLAAAQLGVRLRPALRPGETFEAENQVLSAVAEGILDDVVELQGLMLSLRSQHPPEGLTRSLLDVLTDRFYGIDALALASMREREAHAPKILKLPAVVGIAVSDDQKLALARTWLSAWLRPGVWLNAMPASWAGTEVLLHSGSFDAIKRLLPDTAARTTFQNGWLPELLKTFTAPVGGPGKHRLKGAEVTLEIGGAWEYCQVCRAVQRPFPGLSRCRRCAAVKVEVIDPDHDEVFVARKGYYRKSTVAALAPLPTAPLALIAAEHTAQLGAAQDDQTYSKAEEHELLFQDVALGPEKGQDRPAIDVLSCTTTMEVGIDIGALSGVALRNMPPGRANYQQRAGRAGRRGNTIATVIALANADSHDAHYFAEPDQLVRGRVDDPTLTLDNYDIARRHVTAFLLQRYHADRLPTIAPESQPQLFEVLGSVRDFKGATAPLNRTDFGNWLAVNETRLRAEVVDWIPVELSVDARHRIDSGIVGETLALIDVALADDDGPTIGHQAKGTHDATSPTPQHAAVGAGVVSA